MTTCMCIYYVYQYMYVYLLRVSIHVCVSTTCVTTCMCIYYLYDYMYVLSVYIHAILYFDIYISNNEIYIYTIHIYLVTTGLDVTSCRFITEGGGGGFRDSGFAINGFTDNCSELLSHLRT